MLLICLIFCNFNKSCLLQTTGRKSWIRKLPHFFFFFNLCMCIFVCHLLWIYSYKFENGFNGRWYFPWLTTDVFDRGGRSLRRSHSVSQLNVIHRAILWQSYTPPYSFPLNKLILLSIARGKRTFCAWWYHKLNFFDPELRWCRIPY